MTLRREMEQHVLVNRVRHKFVESTEKMFF